MRVRARGLLLAAAGAALAVGAAPALAATGPSTTVGEAAPVLVAGDVGRPGTSAMGGAHGRHHG